MIKLVYRKRIKEEKVSGKTVMYYNTFDIFLGIALMSLVVFYIHDYLSSRSPKLNENNDVYSNQILDDQSIDLDTGI